MGEFMNDPNFEFLRDFDENIHKTCCEIDLLIYNKFYNASLNASRRAVENLLRNVYGIKKDVDFNFILRNYERKLMIQFMKICIILKIREIWEAIISVVITRYRIIDINNLQMKWLKGFIK